MNKDGSGLVDISELRAALDRAGKNLGPKAVSMARKEFGLDDGRKDTDLAEEVMSKLDTNKDGVLDEAEFKAGYKSNGFLTPETLKDSIDAKTSARRNFKAKIK